ncbi:MAG TPA: hypothetical protein VHA75_01340, partial [Rugosimonospora sp.]|nr:hypothetical protein [Rugosimonospora sp.]
ATTGTPGQVGIVLDGVVVSAPTVAQTIVGDAVINGGGIDEGAATVLAAELTAGSFPLVLRIVSITRQ